MALSGLHGRQAEVPWHPRLVEEDVELVEADAAMAVGINLNEIDEDKMVKRGAFVRTWVADRALNEIKRLIDGVSFVLGQACILSPGFG